MAGSVVYDSLSQFSNSSSSSSLSGGEIAQQFIAHFYKTLAQDVNSLYSLYDDDSTVIRVDSDEEKNTEKPAWHTDKPKKGQVEIHEVSIALPVSKVHIKSFDVCESGQEFLLLVDGSLLFQHKTERGFSHAFLLAPLADNAGYYIKNEILRFHAQSLPVNIQSQQQQLHAVAPQPANVAHTHLSHTEESAVHTQSNAADHHTDSHTHTVEHEVDAIPQKNEESAEHLQTSATPSVSSSPAKSPLKAGKEKARRKRHDASQIEHTSEQKQAEEHAAPKVEDLIIQSEAAVALPTETPIITAAPIEAAPVIALVEEKAAIVETPQPAVAAVNAAPAVAVLPKEEKKPRSWAHVVNKHAPTTNATQPVAPVVTAAPVVKAASVAAASSASAVRPARELPGTVLVSGVPATAKNDDVKLFFSSYGSVTNTRAVTQGGKTSVYVTFASNASANTVANLSNINFLGVQLQVSRSSTAAASDSEVDDGFQQSQNRRHARAQERKQEKQAPTFGRGGRGGRGRGGNRGGSRGGRGGAQNQSNGTQSTAAAATSG